MLCLFYGHWVPGGGLDGFSHFTAASADVRRCAHLGVTVHTFPSAGAGQHKAQIVEGLPGGTCCVGNGFNDIPMFGRAALSVAVIGHEGVCGALLAQADVVVTSIDDALDLLLRKGRLTATLRS